MFEVELDIEQGSLVCCKLPGQFDLEDGLVISLYRSIIFTIYKWLRNVPIVSESFVLNPFFYSHAGSLLL